MLLSSFFTKAEGAKSLQVFQSEPCALVEGLHYTQSNEIWASQRGSRGSAVMVWMRELSSDQTGLAVPQHITAHLYISTGREITAQSWQAHWSLLKTMLFSTCCTSPVPALLTFSLSVCLYQSRFCWCLQASLSGQYCIHCQHPSDAVVTLIVSDKLNNVWNSLHKDCYTDEESKERGLLSSFMAGDVLWPFNWAGLLWYDCGLFI